MFIFASRFYSFVQHRLNSPKTGEHLPLLLIPSATLRCPVMNSASWWPDLLIMLPKKNCPDFSENVSHSPTGLNPEVKEVDWLFSVSSTWFYAWLVTSEALHSRYMCDWWTSSGRFATAPVVSKVLPEISVSTRQIYPPNKY